MNATLRGDGGCIILRLGGDGGGVAVNRGGVARGGLICILRRGGDLLGGDLGGDGVAAIGLACRLAGRLASLGHLAGLFTHFSTLLSCPLTSTQTFLLSLHAIFWS